MNVWVMLTSAHAEVLVLISMSLRHKSFGECFRCWIHCGNRKARIRVFPYGQDPNHPRERQGRWLGGCTTPQRVV